MCARAWPLCAAVCVWIAESTPLRPPHRLALVHFTPSRRARACGPSSAAWAPAPCPTASTPPSSSASSRPSARCGSMQTCIQFSCAVGRGALDQTTDCSVRALPSAACQLCCLTGHCPPTAPCLPSGADQEAGRAPAAWTAAGGQAAAGPAAAQPEHQAQAAAAGGCGQQAPGLPCRMPLASTACARVARAVDSAAQLLHTAAAARRGCTLPAAAQAALPSSGAFCRY